MELLSTEVGGMRQSPEACYFFKEIGRGQAKINGFAIGEDAQDEEWIDLFVSIYKGSLRNHAGSGRRDAQGGGAGHSVFRGALDNLTRNWTPPSPNIRWPSASMRPNPGSSTRVSSFFTDGQRPEYPGRSRTPSRSQGAGYSGSRIYDSGTSSGCHVLLGPALPSLISKSTCWR